MRDRLTLGALAGLAAEAVKWPLGLIAWYLGLAQYLDPHVAAGIWLSKDRVTTPAGFTFGTVGAFIIAAVFGVVIVYVLTATGRDWWWLKGGGIAAFLLVGAFGILVNLGASRVNPTDFGSHAVNAVLYIMWGVLTAYLAVRWGDDELFSGTNKLS